jgi:NADH:ubiquinone oxidoreductase subunit 6 (subunit J)
MVPFCYTEFMKNKKSHSKDRNWPLVFISAVLILIGLVIVLLAITGIPSFGWWSLLIGLAGVTTVGAATMSIIKNDPVWILLDLIIPG